MDIGQQTSEMLQMSQRIGKTGYQTGRASLLAQISLLVNEAVRDGLSIDQFAKRFLTEIAYPELQHGTDV